MLNKLFLATAATAALAAGAAMAAEGETLAQVKSRGVLNCGVNTGLVGFAAPDANGNWSGFDIAICKAVAAAVLGDATKVKYIPTTGQTRFTALSSGEVDVLARNSTWTFQRDTDLKLDFAGVNYYDGQGFMVRKDLGVSSAKELDGATICIQTGTSTELNLADWFRANNMTYQPVNIDSNAEGEQQYMAGACDAYTTDASGLAATRAAFADPDNHIILPEIISKEPLGPAVRHGDNNWGDIVRWVLYALISGEEYGVTSANIEELSKSSTNPDVQRMLGATDDYGAMLGLDKEWAKRAIAASGNYGEIFAANIGEQTPIGLARGLNALWTQGGLMYAMPFR
ncbi:MAG: amino acid ABC transporter substrate-binding protein [Kocuria rhizophila]|uniref:Amino acid ABC transporter substrate-binding protein n=2 Tax=Paracoccus TaxID=265 RepID=A0A099G388_9RHOB|nr:amino acid ABC transporter substrate-binding protein [Paracoccus sanguinis]PZP22242.1 MAG: amino acid ABC transporter substrate-binding protein [Kocuria rhizophila]KGJ17245.1 amino acid ABC transporter substrate-binding protein [Paracoccus sanguinis]KGJ19604.1 amino acid ABC transporter substrate-binding protein [Paracoccus sanguinis]KGJ21455.1 amino acid ABC transporter substrate-binding protein [Paracoccus sanguinis]QJD16448.1 amino acid ABC transporter substrate-binding protein [Paracocc